MFRARKRLRKKTKRCLRRQKKRCTITKEKKMGKRELNEYKKLLLKQMELITGEIQHIAKDTLNKSQRDVSGDVSIYTYHMADVATDSYDREFSLGLADSERKMLYDMNEALKRIEDGTYGNCLECSKRISKRRLRAVPHAKYCIKCQKTLETLEK